MARRAELTVCAARRQLREQVLVDIAHDILICEVNLLKLVDNLCQRTGASHHKSGILHILGKRSVLIGTKSLFNKREHVLLHVVEHSLRFVVSELAPAAILMIGIKDGIGDRHVQEGCVRFLFKLVVIENFNEHEISQLLDDGKRVCHSV